MQPSSRVCSKQRADLRKVQVIPLAWFFRFVEELNLGREIRQPVRALPNDRGHRSSNSRLASIDPRVAIRFVEHQLNRPGLRGRHPAPQRVNVGGRHASRGQVSQIAALGLEHFPGGKTVKHRRHVTSQDADIKVCMRTSGRPAEQVQRPAAGDPPWRLARGKEVGCIGRVYRAPGACCNGVLWQCLTILAI